MDKTASIAASGLEQYAIAQGQSPARDQLGQAQFLELMITQIKHQDPLNPAEGGEFLSQLAQFGTVNGISELQSSFDALATTLQSNQALQASTMVGRSVLFPANVGLLEAGSTLQGAVDLQASGDKVTVLVHDGAGQLVRQIHLGTRPAGRVQFAWDGISDAGTAAIPGTYAVSAQAVADGEVVVQPTLIQGKVESVSLGKAGADASLNLRGLGSVYLHAVAEIL